MLHYPKYIKSEFHLTLTKKSLLCKHSSLKTLKRQISKARNFLICWDNQVHNLTARLFFSEKINRLYLAAFYWMGSFDANFRPLMLNTLND